MKVMDKFNIDIFKLKNDKHEYAFEFDNTFFDEFEDSIIKEGKGTVQVTLDKRESLITLTVLTRGKVVLICDRSLDHYDFPISSNKSLIFKYGDEEKEIDDEVMMITKSTQRINLAQYIYEFIGIEVPMKKLHPRYDREDIIDEIVYSDADKKEEVKTVDPRWEALKKLK